MAEPAISRAGRRRSRSGRRAAAGRGCAASNGVSEPLAASVERAPVTSAARNRRLGLEEGGQGVGGGELRAVEQRQALLGAQRRGVRPACGERLGGGQPAPRRRTPRPRRSSPRPCAPAGARSPDAPTDPWAGTTGVTPCSSIASSRADRRRLDARGPLREAGELQRHHQPRDRHRHRPRRRRRRATGRGCAAGARDRRPRSARWPACRSRY